MSKKRILLVDDDLELCEELAELLRDEGYLVDNTSDALKGAGLVRENRYDVAILDFKMPGLSGVDLLKTIKAGNPKTRVLFVSGKPFVGRLLQEAKVAELVEGIISKPFDEKTLLDKIRGSRCAGGRSPRSG